MTLRLPHVLVMMALILAAGVVSVAVLAPEASVPGVVVIDVPWAGDDELTALAGRHGGVVQAWAPVTDASDPGAPLGPFDTAWAADRAARGDLTALYSLDPRLRRDRAGVDAAGRPAWQVVVDTLPTLAVDARVPWAVASARVLLADQGGTRPFAVGLAFAPGGPPRGAAAGLAPATGAPAVTVPAHATSVARPLPEVVEPLLEAIDELPSYRHSTLVVLGGHHLDGGGRSVLRLDRGIEGVPAADLSDLLETRP